MSRGLLEPEFLARIAGMSFKPRQRMEGSLTGQHRSPHQGASVEFAQHREYCPGDEIRRIDWRAFAKTDRFYIKEFEDETNLRTLILLDCSGSMGYGEAPSKLDYAARLAAGLAFLLLRQGDAVGLMTFGAQRRRYLPPRARRDHLWNLLRVMEEAQAEGETDVVKALQGAAEMASGRSLLILISYCMDFSGRLKAVARQLRRRRHLLSVFQILDPDEWSFPFKDPILFEEMESDDQLLGDPRALAQQYRLEIQGFCEELRQGLLGAGIAYQRVLTEEPVEEALGRALRA